MDYATECKSSCDVLQKQPVEGAQAAAVDEVTCSDAATQRSSTTSSEEELQQLLNVFDYGEWLSHQEYYDDYKHCQHKHVRYPFYNKHKQVIVRRRSVEEDEEADEEEDDHRQAESGRTSPIGVTERLELFATNDLGQAASTSEKELPDYNSIIIEQERTLGRGGIVWCAAYILVDHVLRTYPEMMQSPNTRVLELGAGTGITAVGIAANSNALVTVTDLDLLLPLIRRNRDLNQHLYGGSLHVERLPWGEIVPAVAQHGPYDMILAADCVYADCTHELLPATIAMYAHENTVFVMTCRIRLDEPVNQFEAELRKYFRHVERGKPISSNGNPGVIVMTATGFIVPDKKEVEAATNESSEGLQ